jgi:hypothetical protein
MDYGPLTSGLNIIGAGLFLLHLGALLDVSVRPAAAFPAVDKQTKQLWLILLSIAVAWDALPVLASRRLEFRNPLADLIVLAGTVVALVYLLDARPAVRSAGGRGPRRPPGPRGGL